MIEKLEWDSSDDPRTIGFFFKPFADKLNELVDAVNKLQEKPKLPSKIEYSPCKHYNKRHVPCKRCAFVNLDGECFYSCWTPME